MPTAEAASLRSTPASRNEDAMKFTSPPGRQEFNERVWALVRKVPRGKVATYGQIALMLTPPAGIDSAAYRAFGPRWVGGGMAH